MKPRLFLVLPLLAATCLGQARDYTALLGTYTGNAATDSRGIYAVRLDAETGALSAPASEIAEKRAPHSKSGVPSRTSSLGEPWRLKDTMRESSSLKRNMHELNDAPASAARPLTFESTRSMVQAAPLSGNLGVTA